MKTCPKCGAACTDDIRFCKSCGASLANVSPEGSSPAPVAVPTGIGSTAKKLGIDNMCILGFVLAFFFAPLGLIFSIIGLKRIRSNGQSGRTLALIGLIVSIVVIVGFVLFNAYLLNALKAAGTAAMLI